MDLFGISSSKGQVSAEVLLIFAFVLLIFSFIAFSNVSKQIDVDLIREAADIRVECNRISNTISSVYSGGNGTVGHLRTRYFVTLPGNGSIVLAESINDTREQESQKIAVLASEAGSTSQTFFDLMTSDLNPEWYKTCFDDIGGGPGCQQWSLGMDVPSWNSINYTIEDLMANLSNNPGYYTTVYLEDPHFQYDAEYNGKSYMDILEDWVSAGNVLVLSEHVMCRELFWVFGSLPPVTYRCNPPGYNFDNWEFLGVWLSQESRNGWAEVVNESSELELSIGEQFEMEERNYIRNLDNEGFNVIARYFPGGRGYNDEAAIASWKLGDGRVYYFADFQVTDGLSQEDYTSALTTVIESAYYILHFTSDAEMCNVPVETVAYTNLNGLIKFTNDNGRIFAEQVG